MNKRDLNDCLPLKIFMTGIKTNNRPVTNYFLVVSATGAFAAVSTTGAAFAVSTTAGATTVVSFVASLVSPLLQATKDTDTIANAKITFFIF